MRENTKNILLGLLVVGLIGMTIAYAALSTTLTISGTANVAEAKWDIHIERWVEMWPSTNLAGVANTAVETQAPSSSPLGEGTLISGLAVSLPQPGDTISYTFNIVNDGTINAKLSSFVPSMTATKVVNDATVEANTDDLTYTIVCGEQATKGSQTITGAVAPVQGTDLLDAGKARACKLTISYNVATNDNSGTAGQAQTYTGVARTVTLGADWIWVQN